MRAEARGSHPFIRKTVTLIRTQLIVTSFCFKSRERETALAAATQEAGCHPGTDGFSKAP